MRYVVRIDRQHVDTNSTQEIAQLMSDNIAATGAVDLQGMATSTSGAECIMLKREVAHEGHGEAY